MTDCPCVAPERFPMSCVLELVRIARNPAGDGSMLGEVLTHGGCVALAIGALVGHDDGPMPIGSELLPLMDLAETCDYLENELDGHQETFAATPTAIDPAVIAAIIQLIMQLLELFKKKS